MPDTFDSRATRRPNVIGAPRRAVARRWGVR
jgi:hypothetical protein